MTAAELFTQVANSDITEAYDKIDDILITHGPRLSGDIVAELFSAKNALFRARLLTDRRDTAS